MNGANLPCIAGAGQHHDLRTRGIHLVLAELALECAREVLRPGGDLLLKMFQGEGFDQLLAELRAAFAKVVVRKPKASRPRSREVYLLARNYRLV